MTREREEAIKLLTQYIDYDAETPDYYEMEKACKVALKALKQKPCEDCISRQAVMDIAEGYTMINKCIVDKVKKLPSIQPKPKTGHWIDIMVGDMPAQACDQCNTFYPLAYTGGGHNYCPNCGAKMVEPQESEDKE